MMSVALMTSKGLSLRRALVAAGSSQGSYYYTPVSGRSDRDRLRDPSMLSKIRKLTLRKPTYVRG